MRKCVHSICQRVSSITMSSASPRSRSRSPQRNPSRSRSRSRSPTCADCEGMKKQVNKLVGKLSAVTNVKWLSENRSTNLQARVRDLSDELKAMTEVNSEVIETLMAEKTGLLKDVDILARRVDCLEADERRRCIEYCEMKNRVQELKVCLLCSYAPIWRGFTYTLSPVDIELRTRGGERGDEQLRLLNSPERRAAPLCRHRKQGAERRQSAPLPRERGIEAPTGLMSSLNFVKS